MRSLRGTMVALGAALGAVGVGGVVETACGGGSSSSATVADSGSDVTNDRESDTGSQTGRDAGGDSALQSETDGGGGDAASAALAFALHVATASCSRWLSCCANGQDAGSYDLQRCIDSNTTGGWEGNLPYDVRVYSRGHIKVDQARAAGCISALRSFPCGMQTPAQWGAITAACELVIQGTIPSNTAGCISSFECAPGNYCDPTVGGGTCTPLAKQGQPCNTKINDPTGLNPLADEMCSYLSSGQPPLFCDMIDNAPDAATCQPLLANGASCSNPTTGYYDDQACVKPALCGDNLQCGGNATYPYANFCQFYLRDAGGPD